MAWAGGLGATIAIGAAAAKDQIDRTNLASLAELHHREDPDG